MAYSGSSVTSTTNRKESEMKPKRPFLPSASKNVPPNPDNNRTLPPGEAPTKKEVGQGYLKPEKFDAGRKRGKDA